MNKDREIRSIVTNFNIEKREDGVESRVLQGYAIVFNQDSEDMGFRERILPGAITEDVINHSDMMK